MAVFQVGEPPVDPEVMLAEMQREQEDVRWIKDNMPALVEQYGINFVAVRHRKVIGASPRLSLLLENLRERGVAPGSASIEVLSRQK